MRTNITAHTTVGTLYPSYFSVNTDESGEVEFTVRSEAQTDGSCGVTACMKMSAADYKKAVTELYVHACHI